MYIYTISFVFRSGDLDDVFEMALECAQVQIKLR